MVSPKTRDNKTRVKPRSSHIDNDIYIDIDSAPNQCFVCGHQYGRLSGYYVLGNAGFIFALKLCRMLQNPENNSVQIASAA